MPGLWAHARRPWLETLDAGLPFRIQGVGSGE